MSEIPIARPSRRIFPRLLISFIGFAVLVAVFYAEENWRGKRAWENFKREWEAKGERFDWQSVVPPRVPDDQNFALTPIVFTSYGQELTRDGKAIPIDKRDTNFVNRLRMDAYFGVSYDLQPTNDFGSWAKATKTDFKILQQFYRTAANPTNGIVVSLQPQSPAADVLLALSKYDSTIEELRAAAQLPYSRFPLDYGQDCPAAIGLPHLAGLKKCSQVLSLRACAELQNGQSEKALADVKLLLRLMDSIRNEPLLISHLVRLAIFQISLRPIYEGLAEHCWSEPQLVALEAELGKLDFLTDWLASMRGERAWDVANIDWLRRSKKDYYCLLHDDFGVGKVETFALTYGPSGWLEQNKVRLCGFFPNIFAVVDLKMKTVLPASVRQASAVLESETQHQTPFNYLEKMFLPALVVCAQKAAYTQAAADMARTAVALERYRLAHENYPDSLAALAPQFIAQVPHDAIGGQPLQYRRTDDGKFVLYSVGWNETNDGGVVAFRKNSPHSLDNEHGDWVWQYPLK